VPNTVDPLKALQTALAAEHAAVYGYGLVGARLNAVHARSADRAERDWRAHRAHRDQLIGVLRTQGATPIGSRPGYRMPFSVKGPRTAAKLAVHIEDGVAAAYLQLVAVADPTLRTLGAKRLKDTAVRAARWRGSTTAFPGMPN